MVKNTGAISRSIGQIYCECRPGRMFVVAHVAPVRVFRSAGARLDSWDHGLRVLPLFLLVAPAAMLLVFAFRVRCAAAGVYPLARPLGFLLLTILLIGCGGGSSISPRHPGVRPRELTP